MEKKTTGTRNAYRYELEDLAPLPARAKRVFRVTDYSAPGVQLNPVPDGV